MTTEIAKAAAIRYVDQKHDPLKRRSGFSKYYIRVGIDKINDEELIFAEELPGEELLLISDKDAIKRFTDNCDQNNEHLIKITVDLQRNQLNANELWRA